MNQKYVVKLTVAERERLQVLVAAGTERAPQGPELGRCLTFGVGRR